MDVYSLFLDFFKVYWVLWFALLIKNITYTGKIWMQIIRIGGEKCEELQLWFYETLHLYCCETENIGCWRNCGIVTAAVRLGPENQASTASIPHHAVSITGFPRVRRPSNCNYVCKNTRFNRNKRQNSGGKKSLYKKNGIWVTSFLFFFFSYSYNNIFSIQSTLSLKLPITGCQVSWETLQMGRE